MLPNSKLCAKSVYRPKSAALFTKIICFASLAKAPKHGLPFEGF
jgi:hypothetical protein